MTEPGPPPPGADVIAAFGLSGLPEPIAGGTGRSWRVGGRVFKPLDMQPEELAWHAQVLGSIEAHGIRVARPVHASDGRLVVDGWTASTWLEGAHQPWWRAVIEAGEPFHDALATVPRPAFLDRRTDPWSIADRVAWEELPLDPHVEVPAIRDLGALRRPVAAASQLVHGDLTGNVLFSPTDPPAIIDFAPYWRPRAFASAVVIVDALAWEGADTSIGSAIAGVERPEQYLIRAAIYRMVTDHLTGTVGELLSPDGGPYLPAMTLIRELARIG